MFLASKVHLCVIYLIYKMTVFIFSLHVILIILHITGAMQLMAILFSCLSFSIFCLLLYALIYNIFNNNNNS